MKLLNQSKLGLFAILALGITLTSCKKLDNLVQVNVGLEMAQVPFQINEQGAATSIDSATIHFDVDSAIKANNTSTSLSAANIKSAKIDSIVLTLTEGSFIASDITAATASSYSDTYTTPVFFTANIAGESATSLTFLPSGTVDLTNYLKATSFTYSFDIVHGSVSPSLVGTAAAYFHVEVAPN